MGLAAVTDSEILIREAAPEHLGMVRLAFRRLGIEFEVRGAGRVRARPGSR